MPTETQQSAASGEEVVLEESSSSLLDQAISATRQTDATDAKALLKAVTEQALKGTVSWDKNINLTLEKAIVELDKVISKQVAAILHNEKVQKLEGSWRGLHHLVTQVDTGTSLKVSMFNANKQELAKDLAKASEFDQSHLFKKIYETEFGTAGGEPFGTLIGDYEFNNTADDMDTLTEISHVAAAGFCPFIAAASANLFGFDDFTEMGKPRDLQKIFDSAEYAKWRSFRESDDSRFVSLVLPRTLARAPYGADNQYIESFSFEEFPVQDNGYTQEISHDKYTWMNASYSMGAVLARSFSNYGWCTSIRGTESGGKVDDLPTHVFTSDDGDLDQKCPTEVGITDRREAELSNLGFLPLCHYKNTDYAVFFGSQTTQKPKQYADNDATANAEISARLPYIMATSRIAHYLKVMARDKVGSFMEAQDAENWLNDWILSYVNSSGSTPESKAKRPLAEAKVEVKEVPGRPGSYTAIAYLRPWLQMEELTSSLRLVASLPKGGK